MLYRTPLSIGKLYVLDSVGFPVIVLESHNLPQQKQISALTLARSHERVMCEYPPALTVYMLIIGISTRV